MSLVRYYIGPIARTIKNGFFYFKKREFIQEFLDDHGYTRIKPFNLSKWHHELYLFTATDKNGEEVFIKLTNLDRLLKNENRAYKKLQRNDFLKSHVIEHKGYLKKDGYKALVLKRANGIVLSEDWMVDNINQLGILVKIVDEFNSLSLVHRDIKPDNFIYEEGQIKVFDFSFMIDKTEKRKFKEIDLSRHKNLLKLEDLGIHYKPEPLKWDDYYALHVIFNTLLKNKSLKIPFEKRNILSKYAEECKGKIGTNSYTVLK